MILTRLLAAAAVFAAVLLAVAPAAYAQNGGAPTTPEGEPQPPAEQPAPDGGAGEPTYELPQETTGGAGAAGDAAGGTLPRTGLETLALLSVGLGLLLAGAALWPTSSWPPPRGRLSRSTSARR